MMPATPVVQHPWWCSAVTPEHFYQLLLLNTL